MDNEILFLGRLIEFIESCPFLNATGSITASPFDPINRVVVVPFDPNVTQGNGLSYNGLSAPIIQPDVMGNIRITNQANFTLNILRQIIDPISNQETAEFISRFEQWVLYQSLRKKAPLFGSRDYDERMWADGGFLWNVVQDAQIPFAAYQTNIHINYQIELESEDEY